MLPTDITGSSLPRGTLNGTSLRLHLSFFAVRAITALNAASYFPGRSFATAFLSRTSVSPDAEGGGQQQTPLALCSVWCNERAMKRLTRIASTF